MSHETCLCIDLRAAAQRLTQLYDEAMAPSGITVTQFSQLHLIQALKGVTLKDLAAASGLDRSTLGRNIRVLERMGLVSMQVGTDARTRTIRLTRKGVRAYQRALPLWHGVQSELVGKLGADRREQLQEILHDLTMPALAS